MLKHDYKCDKCGKPATYNVQRNWQTYTINNKGNFHLIEENEGDVNDFFCDDCKEKEDDDTIKDHEDALADYQDQEIDTLKKK